MINTKNRRRYRGSDLRTNNQGWQTRRLAVNESIWAARAMLGRGLGETFDGARDLYETLGYKKVLTTDDYQNAYRRNIVGKRLVKKPVSSTWQTPPIIKDGEESTESKDPQGDFIKALTRLNETRRIWHYLERADRMARLGRYGVLFIGVKDGKLLAEPIDDTTLTGPESLLYLMPRSEEWAQIASYDTDPQSARYGLPEFYNITTGQLSGTGTVRVHHSRVIHIAEGKENDEVFGTPALEAAMNSLSDLEKVVGGDAEAFWLLVRKGMAILGDNETDFSQADESFQEEIDKYKHGLTRIMQLAGIKEIKEFGSDTPDPTGIFEVLIALLAADADMPQAILVGTQKNGLGGDASGDTDQKLWAATIENRRNQFAGPEILRPFLDFCLKRKILPQPTTGKYTTSWDPPYTPSAQDWALVAKTYAEAADTYSDARIKGFDEVMPPEVFSDRYFDYVPEVTPAEAMAAEDKLLGQAEANDSN